MTTTAAFQSDYAIENNLREDVTTPFDRDGVSVVLVHAGVTEAECDRRWLEYYQTRNPDVLGVLGSDVWCDYDYEDRWAVYLNGAQVAGPFETMAEANDTAEAVHTYARHTQRRAS